MAATSKSSGRKRTTKRSSGRKSGASKTGNKAVQRASASLDASQKALRDLRDELQRGGSKLLRDADLRDLEKTLKSAGTSFRRLSTRLLKDLEDVQKAATGGKRPSKRKTSSGRKTTAKGKSSSGTKRKSSSTKRKSSSAKRSTKKSR